MAGNYLLRTLFGFLLKHRVLSIGTKYYPTNEKETEYVEMDFLYHSLHYFARWLLMLGKHASIVAPEDLKIIIKQQISELDGHYS